MTELAPDPATEQVIMSLVDQWLDDPTEAEPLQGIRDLMDAIRALPRGESRLKCMNTFVRTLGTPRVFATFLDMMRDAAGRPGTAEEELSRVSQTARKHCIYGWCGQTLLLTSSTQPTEGTQKPEPGLWEMLGDPPPAAWGLSMHIWQPNPNAKGFPSGGRIDPDVIVEPPHSHPFDFASMVAIGSMRQSIYTQNPTGEVRVVVGREGRYDGVLLEHVDGVWPPHGQQSSCEVGTLEARVLLQAGDSYYMPCDKIHDVEIDARTAGRTPAITLFLASEAVVKPHVYMAQSMVDMHEACPHLRHEGQALPPEAWHAKLTAVASYLRGEQSTLSLDDIVNYDGDYAFFHA